VPGLIKNTVEIPLGLGIQTDVDDKLLPAGKVVTLENGVWERGGEILKRVGSFALGTQYAANTPGTMPAAWQLATHKGALVSLSKAGPRPIGVYSPGTQKWVAPAGSTALDNINGVFSKLRGQVLPRRTTVYRGNSAGEGARRVSRPTSATNGTYTAVCWVEENAGAAKIWVYFYELATGKKLFEYSQSMATSTTNVRVVFVNGEFDLLYLTGANLRARLWTVANIAAGGSGWQVSGEFTLATDNGTAALDVIAQGTDLYALYCNGVNQVRIAKATGGVLGNTFTLSTLTDSVGGAVNAGAVAWMRDLSASGARSAIIGSGAQGVTVQWNITGGTPTASYTIDAAAGAPTFLSGFTATNAGTGDFAVLWDLNDRIRWGRRVGGVVLAPSTWIFSAGLASMPWLHSGQFYCLTRYDSVTQGTLFASRIPTTITDATDNTRTPSARFCSGQSVTLSTSGGTMPDVAQLSTDAFLVAANVKTRLVETPVGDTFDTGIDTITLTYNPANVNSPREFADNLYVCGGILAAFDGVTYAEEGFHLFPEITNVAQQLAGNLAITGNYQWCAVYRYTDNYGRIRRSSPSEPTDPVNMTGSNKGALVSVKTLKLHGRPCRVNDGGRAGSVVIELYRTTNNETDLFQLAAVVDNDESVDTVTFTDTAGDTSLGEDLYTGNPGNTQAEFESPPPALAVATYKDRVAIIAADDPTLIWISLPLSETEGPRFNSESTIRITDARGDLTGLAAVDDKLIAFKRDAIYVITGDGPDVAGNGSFGIATPFALGVGTVEPRSIVEVPDGVMFRSSSARAGIFLANRGLAIEYAGKDVERFVTSGLAFPAVTIADAIHVPGLTRTEFLTTLGTTLIYDYTMKLWATATNQATTAATVWNGRHAYLISTSILFVAAERTDDTFDDTSSPVGLYLETPWLALNKLKGFEKFFKVQLVGEKRIINDASDPGYILELSLYKDYNLDAFLTRQTRTMTVSDDPNLVELKFPSKLGAIKVGVGVRMNPTDGANFAGPKLSALVIQYGMKEGLRKTAYTNRTT
jgi:hypothetical protein